MPAPELLEPACGLAAPVSLQAAKRKQTTEALTPGFFGQQDQILNFCSGPCDPD